MSILPCSKHKVEKYLELEEGEKAGKVQSVETNRLDGIKKLRRGSNATE